MGSLFACVAPPEKPQLFQLKPESREYKARQTRLFETSGEVELLSASAAVLQDLGFQVTESVHELGYLRAMKERSARQRDQAINRVLIMFFSLGGAVIPVDLHQRIEASIVARPLDGAGTRHEVRIQFYRIIWLGDGQTGNPQGQSEYIPPGQQKMEMVRDPEIYQQFFTKLSKAVFLEAFTI